MQSKTMATNLNLPWDVIIEIFFRLPVKSLIRFRLVSKSYNSLVTDPQFITRHLQHSKHNLKRVILSLTKQQFHKHLVSCPISSLSHKPITDAVKLVYDRPGCIELSDSYNGLFCFETIDGVFLWNPSTRQCMTLPDAPFDDDRDRRRDYCSYALGYDSSVDDYKVVLVLEQNYSNSRLGAILYSLKTNSWKKVEGIAWASASDCCKYVNGAFYWLACDRYVKYPNNDEYPMIKGTEIISLNISTERFAKVSLPNHELLQNSEDKVKGNLAVLKGMLCLSAKNVEHSSFIIWAMKDCGDQDSWQKIFVIPNTRYSFIRPVYLFEDGEILLKVGTSKGDDEVVTYKKNRCGLFKKVIVHRLNCIKEAYAYAESLISPFTHEGVSK